VLANMYFIMTVINFLKCDFRENVLALASEIRLHISNVQTKFKSQGNCLV